MKKTFLRILPVVAAVLLATSCSKDDDGNINSVDTPQTTDANIPTPEQPAEQAKTVKIPFSVKVDGGESLSKITYVATPIEEGSDKVYWNKVSRTFDDDDLSTGEHPISLTVKGAAEGSGITESTIPLTKGTDGKYYFEGDIEVSSEKVADFNGETGIALVGEFSVTGTALPTSSVESLAALMASCSHTYKTKDGDFTSKSTSITLYDRNVYLAVQMSKLQHVLDVKIGDAALSDCKLNSDGQVWIALEGGKSVATNFLSKSASEVAAGHIYTIDRSGFVDLGISGGILWADHNIGATNPWDYGDYYAWGETDTKTDYSWSTYRYGSASNALTKYCNNSSFGNYVFADSYTVLGKYTITEGEEPVDDDIAHVKDSKWSMPTTADFAALNNSCHWVWTAKYDDKTYNGEDAAGYIVYKKKSSGEYSLSDAHIFLPAAGYRYGADLYDAGSGGTYWSSSLYTDLPSRAYDLTFLSSRVNAQYSSPRDSGQSVRAVRRK